MGKKGLNILIFCTFASLFLLLVPFFVTAGTCFYDVSTGSCAQNVGTQAQCVDSDLHGTLFSESPIESVNECQLTGCCCYGSVDSPSSVATVSQAACNAIPTQFSFRPTAGLGFIAGDSASACAEACGQPAGTWSADDVTHGCTASQNYCSILDECIATDAICQESQNNGGPTTPTCDTGKTWCSVLETCLDDGVACEQTTVVTNLDDCRSKITGTVTAAFGLPLNLLVYSQNTRANAWGIVSGDGTFTIEGVCAGDHLVSASNNAGDYTSTTQTVTVAQDATTSGVSLVLSPSKLGTIKGTVVNASNQAIKVFNATVRVSGTPYSAKTNSSGEFTIYIPKIQGTSQEYTLMTSTGNDLGSAYIPTTTQVVLSESPESARTVVVTIPLVSQLCSGSALPVFVSNISIRGQPKVNITWTMPSCEGSVLSYLLQRCEGKAADCSFSETSDFITISDLTAKSYVDNLEWGKNYTYRVGAVYPGPMVNVSPAKVTVDSGDAECEGIVEDSFCGTALMPLSPFARVDAKLGCSPSNQYTSTLCDQNSICIVRSGTYTNGAQCIAPTACAESTINNPFGLYSSQNSCAQFGEPGTCYFDRQTSNVNACLGCKQGMTCSDYKTKSACNFDAQSCDVKNCQWNEIDSILGIGVCKTTKAPTCGDCSIAGKSPFGVCNSQTCAALGTPSDSCFYSQVATTCTACSATQCGNYTTQDACQGANGHGSTILDAATNAFTQTSADSCNMNVCRWKSQPSQQNGGTCFKDSDADTVNDCTGSSNVTRCNLDRSPPTTFVIMPNISNPFLNNITIRFIPQDKGNIGSAQTLTTRFCVSSDDGTGNRCDVASQFAIVQPSPASGGIVNITGGTIYRSATTGINEYIKTLDSEGGSYTLHYYSVDIAKNIEVVKTKKFIINTTPPEINLTVTSFVVPATVPMFTDVVATVTSQVDVRCQLSVVKFAEVNYNPDVFTSSTPRAYAKLHESVFRRADGSYAVKATCRDVNGNFNVQVQQIDTAADTRVRNIKPTGLLATANPTFSIETKLPVTCKMTADGQNSDFATYEYSFTRSTTAFGTGNDLWYNHTLQLSTPLADGPHTFQVMCDFSEYSRNIISFTTNTQASSLTYEQGQIGVAYNFTKWHSDFDPLYAGCSDAATPGISCYKIEYCKVPKAFGTGVGQTCTPNINSSVISTLTTKPRFIIPFDDSDRSTVVCARAYEALTSGTGSSAVTTYRMGDTRCENILFDRIDPRLKVETLPTITSKEFITISGFVFDPVVYISSLSDFTSKSATSGTLTVPFFGGKITPSNLYINGTLSLVSNTAQPSYLDILLRNGSSTSSVVVRLDMRDVTNGLVSKLSIISNGVQVGTSTVVPVLSATNANWSITLDGASINVTINGVSTVATVAYDKATSAGNIAFKAYNTGAGTGTVANGFKPDAHVDKVSVVDLDLSQLNPLSLVVQVGAGSNDLSSKVNIGSMGSFKKDVYYADAYEDDTSYSLFVLARDPSGRESTKTNGNILFSTSGPKITALTFRPETSPQSTTGFIEFRTNATAKLFTTSGYDLGTATLTSAITPTESTLQSLETLTDYGFTGRFNTYDLPTGYNDVTANVTDILGTQTIKLFPKSLWIRNTLDPNRNISLPDKVITNSTYPTFTFPVRDEGSITCTATYNNATGRSRTDTFTSTGTGLVTLTLSQPLASKYGEMVETQVLVACHRNAAASDIWRHNVYVTVDLRSPVIAARLASSNGLVLTSYDRITKNYLSYVADEKNVQISADEPVLCRIDDGEQITTDGELVYSSTLVARIPTVDQTVASHTISCTDQAGNIATVNRVVSITTNSTAAPYISNVSTQKYITTLSTPFSVETTILSSCNVSIQGQAASVELTADSSSLPVHHSGTLTFAQDGTYLTTITCSESGRVTTKVMSLVVDTTNPLVTVTPELAPIMYTQSATLPLSIVTNEDVVVRVKNLVDVMFEQQLPRGSSNIEIALPVGTTDALVSITDLAGNYISTPMQLRRASFGFRSQFVDLLPYSTRSEILNNEVKVTLDNVSNDYKLNPLNGTLSAVNVTALLYVNGSADVLLALPTDSIKLSSTANGARANLTFAMPSSLFDGTYMLIYKIIVNNVTVAADSAVFTIDKYAESIYTLRQFNTTQRNRQAVLLNLSLPYKNLVSSDTSAWNEDENTIDCFPSNLNSNDCFFGHITSRLDVSSSNPYSLFAYSAVNELGHESRVLAKITHDTAIPSSPVDVVVGKIDATIHSTNPTTSSPVPEFKLTYDEPLRLISAQIKSTGANAVGVAVNLLNGAQDQQFYDALDIRSSTRLNDGAYVLYLTLANSAGTVIATNYQYLFNVKAGKLSITLVNPPFGRTSTDVLDLEISTDRPAVCGYAVSGTVLALQLSTMYNFTATDGSTHSVSIPFRGSDTGVINYQVSCVENGTLVPVINKTIGLEKNTVAPQITSLTIPTASGGVVSNPFGDANLSVITNVPAVCRYVASSGAAFNLMTPFEESSALSINNSQKISGLENGESYTYTVVCENGAGVTSAPVSISFRVDVLQTGLINLASPKDGAAYSTTSLPILFTLVRPALDSQGCVWSKTEAGLATANYVNPTSTNKTTYSLSALTFNSGDNEFYVKCKFPGAANESGGVKNETVISRFTVDTTIPEKLYVYIPNITTSKSRISNVVFAFRDNESSIALYEYAVGTAPYGSGGWNNTLAITGSSSAPTEISGLNLTNGSTYYVSAQAKNAAGKPSGWISSNATIAKISGSGGSGGGITVTNTTPNTTTVTLPNGTTVTYPNGTTTTLPNGTKIVVPSNTSGQYKPGASVTLPAGTKFILPNGTQITVPANTRVTLPQAIVTTDVVTQTKSTLDTNTTGKNQTKGGVAPKTNNTNQNQNALDLPSAFGASLLLFLLTLGLVGGGAGYFFYARKQQRKNVISEATGGYGSSSSSSYSDDVVVPSGPLTVNDKLKLALQSRIRKQRGDELPGKTSHLFSAFDKDEKSPFSPRIGLTRESSSSTSSSPASSVSGSNTGLGSDFGVRSTSSGPMSSSSGSNDIDMTLQRTQASLDRLKSIASKQQKPVSQLRRLQSKPGSQTSSALTRLRSLHKK